MVSGRRRAPKNLRERTRTSIEAISLFTQWWNEPSGSSYCTCTICEGWTCTTPSMARRAFCAEKCQAGAAGLEVVSAIQGPRNYKSGNDKEDFDAHPAVSSGTVEESGAHGHEAHNV